MITSTNVQYATSVLIGDIKYFPAREGCDGFWVRDYTFTSGSARHVVSVFAHSRNVLLSAEERECERIANERAAHDTASEAERYNNSQVDLDKDRGHGQKAESAGDREMPVFTGPNLA